MAVSLIRSFAKFAPPTYSHFAALYILGASFCGVIDIMKD